jgi:hypothetical protein
MVEGLNGREYRYRERCKEIGLRTLEERRKIQDMQLLQGIVHGRGGMSIEYLFERVDIRDGMRTRQAAGTNNQKCRQQGLTLGKISSPLGRRKLGMSCLIH